MSAQPGPTVFLSHSHIDKRVARRLLRRLTAHGIKVWIDERELPVGAPLTSSIRTQIQGADSLLVVASQASADSEWVGMELECAREHGKTVIPLFVEPVTDNERFRDIRGVKPTSPQAFADDVHDLMRGLFRSLDLELPQPDPAVLSAELRELAREEPDLAPLILGCLDSQVVNRETAFKAPFHPLDEALNALFDLMPNDDIAYRAADGFCLAGVGTRALSSWIAATKDGGEPLVNAVGNRLEPALIDTAIKLLTSCDPPNNRALYMFIDYNFEQLDHEQRQSVRRLVTSPLREKPDRWADVLGWVALTHFPDAVEIQQMWSRWIRTGSFDHHLQSAEDLAKYLADAKKQKLRGWEDVNLVLRNHVRVHLRSGDKEKVEIAVDHIKAAANTSAPVLESLLLEADRAMGSAEWDDWEKRDRETAELMKWHVYHVSEEAGGNRDWDRAREGAEKMVAFEKERRRILGI